MKLIHQAEQIMRLSIEEHLTELENHNLVKDSFFEEVELRVWDGSLRLDGNQVAGLLWKMANDRASRRTTVVLADLASGSYPREERLLQRWLDTPIIAGKRHKTLVRYLTRHDLTRIVDERWENATKASLSLGRTKKDVGVLTRALNQHLSIPAAIRNGAFEGDNDV